MNGFAILLLSIALFFTFHATIKAQAGMQIQSGALHSLALTAEGELFVWGHNDNGQLGLGDLRLRSVPTRAALKTPIKSVFAKRDHACAIFADNQLKCWGANHSFQLGLPHLAEVVGDSSLETIEQLSAVDLGVGQPVKAILGNRHSCALIDDRRLKCFGYNGNGELGIGKKQTILGAKAEEMGEALIAARVGGDVQDGCAGNGFTCVLLSDHRVKCFGSYISSGNETKSDAGLDPSSLGENLKSVELSDRVNKLACGDQFVCALLESGEVQCWGKSMTGSLGLGVPDGTIVGDEPDELNAVVSIEPGLRTTDIACGFAHCCAILENCGVKCWGRNSVGQLGLGDTRPRGGKLSDMGRALPYVDLGKDYCAGSLTLGSASSCATFSSGEVKCWGGNNYGQLGVGFHLSSIGKLPTEMGEALQSLTFSPRDNR